MSRMANGAAMERVRRRASQPLALWIAFLLVHVVLGWLCLNGDGMGDVNNVYKSWAQGAAQGGSIVGVQVPWVYPFAALVPILLPLLLGPDSYAACWLTMVLVLNAGAFAVLIGGRDPRRLLAAWWWLGFLLLLGPVGIARLDAVSVAIAIVGLLWLNLHETAAIATLTIATWIKVWPAALIASAIVALRTRRHIALVGLVTSAIIVAVPLIFGAGMNVLSFITAQTGRGLQIESPVSTIWMWRAAWHTPDIVIYYDRQILTFQVTGPGTATASSLMNPLLGVAVIAVVLVGIRAVRLGTPVTRILPELSLAFICAFITFNKVGSPQYVAWLAAPVILGLVYQGRGFRIPAVLAAVAAGLTQVFYPYLYDSLLLAEPWAVTVLTVRNLLYFVLLGWAVTALWGRSRHADAAGDRIPSSVWPFRSEPAASPPAVARLER